MTTEPNRIIDAATGKVPVLEGAGLVQDVGELTAAVASGQWAGGFASLLSAGFAVKDTLQDPMAKLISMGLGWAIEFFGSWSGAAVDQYRTFCADRVNLYDAAAGAAAVTANLINHNKILLTIVRSIVFTQAKKFFVEADAIWTQGAKRGDIDAANSLYNGYVGYWCRARRRTLGFGRWLEPPHGSCGGWLSPG